MKNIDNDSTVESSNEQLNSIALFAVKSHAIDQGFDMLLMSVLDDIDKYNDKLMIGLKEETLQVLRDIKIVPFYRSISRENELINAMYYNKILTRGDKHLEKLSEYYTGLTLFFLILSKSNQETLEIALNELKGQSKIYNENGDTKHQAKGLRGKFIPAQKDLTNKPELKGKEYLFFNNIIHSSDDSQEVAMFLKIVLNNSFYELPRKYRNTLLSFIEYHYPTKLMLREI